MKINNIVSLYPGIKATNSNKARQTYPNLQPLRTDTVSFQASPKALAKKISIISGSANPELAEAIAKKLGLETGKRSFKKFADGEICPKIIEEVQGKKVFLVQPSANPVNDSIMELCFMCDAAKDKQAKEVIAVMPYMGYERQDKAGVGEALGARMHAKFLQAAGFDKVIAMDLHAPQLKGFYESGKLISLSATPEMVKYIKSKNIEDLVIVSPDLSGRKRVTEIAKELGVPCATIHKERPEANVAEAVDLYGDVKGKNCVICDDMIDTAGTIVEAVNMLKDRGAKDVYICATHGLFNGPAFERLNNAPVKEVIVTNTLPLKPNAPEKIHQVDISGIIADTLKKLSAN